MVIQIDGINTQNKGAELMLVAILEEIESRIPGSTVWLNPNGELDVDIIPRFNLDLRFRSVQKNGRLPRAILRRLRLPYRKYTHFRADDGIDIMLDASGFQFSDQWKHSDEALRLREDYYIDMKNRGTKIVLLPQAFGPFDTASGKKSAKIIAEHFDLIFAREQQSFDYLTSAVDLKSRIYKSCDFTFKVKGIVPKEFENLRGAICVIPNKKMITHTGAEKSSYLDLMNNLISCFKKEGKDVFLLNHEGMGDRELCQELNALNDNKLGVVDGLTAKQVKGVIGISHIVISSRFHGVASSLSQGIPCLATSWNHKYEMLFNDFGQSDRILDASQNWAHNSLIVDNLVLNHVEISEIIRSKKAHLTTEIDNMWNTILS